MDGNAVSKELCEKEHKSVKEKLDHHENWLGEHEKKIDALEKSDATNTNEIKNLCTGLDKQSQAINSQTKAIWGLVLSIISVLAGFFIWYVQTK